MARKQRQFRRQQVPDYVRTADSRETSLLATSPATMKSHEARRGTPIIVPATVKQVGMHRLSVKELMELRIDTRYQREEITDEVNMLIVVLKKGGMIPDPISVVVRKYGDNAQYIVDGQQRWWAHVDVQKPIQAVLYEVQSYEDEVVLFHALNSQTRLTAGRRLASLPGPLGDTIRRLGASEESPFKGQISLGSGSGRIDGMTLARGLAALLTNGTPGGSLDAAAKTFEVAYRIAPVVADKVVDRFAKLVSEVFTDSRLRAVSAVAFARVCYAEFTRDPVNMPLPSPSQIARLRVVDWSHLIPSHSMQWVPTVIERIQSIWPVEIVQSVRTAKGSR